MRQSISGGATGANTRAQGPASLPPTRASRAWAIAGGFSVILLFIFSEALPFASTFSKIALNATVHVLVLVFPPSWMSQSSYWLIIGSVISLVVMAVPFVKNQHRRSSLPPSQLRRVVGGILFLVGLSFFPLAVLLPNASSIGQLWSLTGFTWIGANVLAEDLDFFWASVVGLFIWDLGAGAQGLAYNMRGLNEPYGNHISPVVVTAIDCTGIVLSSLGWKLGLDPGKLLRAVSERTGSRRESSKSTTDPLATRP